MKHIPWKEFTYTHAHAPDNAIPKVTKITKKQKAPNISFGPFQLFK